MLKSVTDASVEFSNLVEILRWRALHQPERLAYTFLINGESEEVHLTYAELDRQARSIAAKLQSINAGGERALLLYPPGLDYVAAFWGCLYAGAVAVPAYPPRINRSLQRLQAIAADAQARVALTTAPMLCGIETMLDEMPGLKALRWIATTNDASGLEKEWQETAINGDSLAFLQYTSGSTARAKGVMLSHRNLLYNSSLIAHGFESSSESRGVIWLPPYHDMGLIGGIIQPLYAGFPVVLMSPISLTKHPLLWLQAISRHRATISGGPNFAYELCLSRISAEQRAGLDLSCWEVAFTGAEPIRPETLIRFANYFGPCGFRREAFYPCYGLAEATLIVSGGFKHAPPVIKRTQALALENHRVIEVFTNRGNIRAVVGCGHTLPEQTILIVNPESRRQCAANEVGEIWVNGPSVAKGYWYRLEETERNFNAYLSESGEGPFLRTGDLGFMDDGELFVTGRLKDLIIIDGRNHYPEDIERTVEESHPAIRRGCCAAFAVDLDNREHLVIMAEVERVYRDVKMERVVKDVRRAVRENHDLQPLAVMLLKTGNIPKTSSGKIQRYACRAEYLAAQAGSMD
ncbi:MAG TPA: fatty acyl-AMP ligase [Pyrinomonadaceae bacterium]|jgi:acyl-CoA synthetase (AMP-forming)/AMP-acid ligase II